METKCIKPKKPLKKTVLIVAMTVIGLVIVLLSGCGRRVAASSKGRAEADSVKTTTVAEKKDAAALVVKAKSMGYSVKQDRQIIGVPSQPGTASGAGLLFTLERARNSASPITFEMYPRGSGGKYGHPFYVADSWCGAAPDNQVDDFTFPSSVSDTPRWDISPVHYDFILSTLTKLANRPDSNPFLPIALPAGVVTAARSAGWLWQVRMAAYAPGGGDVVVGRTTVIDFTRNDTERIRLDIPSGFNPIWRITYYGPKATREYYVHSYNDATSSFDFTANICSLSPEMTTELTKVLKGDIGSLDKHGPRKPARISDWSNSN